MSKQIENNVVQMTFDNKDFEKNISTSTKSIEKLNEELQFKGASDGFKDLEKYANSINFDGLNKAIGNINSVFTITGALTKKVIDDIAGYFESKIVGAINSVKSKINYIVDPSLGISKYEQYTNAILTMSSNLSDYDQNFYEQNKSELGSQLEYVESYIEKMALYTDETSYSLTDMVDTMSKFAASNVNLEKSSSAMMGLANMAAVAGQNARIATSSMTQLAQAFGTGYVKYQDWAQAFTLKNIATKESKEIFLKAAKEIGTINNEDIAQAKKELGDNWMNWFYTSDKLNQGWLKTDTVLVKGLQEYSKASDLILEKMEDIGDVSVTDLLTWTEEFQEAGGSAEKFAESVAKSSGSGVKDVKALTELLQKLNTEEYALSLKAFRAAQMATNLHEALDSVRDAVGTKMMYALKYFIGDLDQARHLWTSFSNSLWEVFAGPFDNMLEGLAQWNAGIIEFEEGSLKSIEFVDNYEKFWSSLGEIFTNVRSIVGGLVDQFRILAGCFENVNGNFETTSIIATYTLRFMRKVTHILGDIADATSDFLDSDLYRNIQEIFMNIIKTIRNVKRIVGSVFDATVGTILKNLGGPLTAISEIILEISQRFEMWTDRILRSQGFQRLIEVLTKLTTKFMELGTYLIGKFGNILLKIIDKIALLAIKLIDFLSPAIEAILDFIEEEVIPFIDDLIDGQYGLGAAIDWLGGIIDNVIPSIETFCEDVLGMSFEDIGNAFADFVDGFVDKVKKLGTEGFDILKGFFQDTFNTDVEGSLPALFDIFKEADDAAGVATGLFEWTGDAASRVVKLVMDLAGLFIGRDMSGIADDICNFIKKITGALGNVAPTVLDGVEVVIGVLIKVLKEIGSIVVTIVKYLGNITDTTGFKVLDDVLYGFKVLLSAVLEAFGHILTAIANLIRYMTPKIAQGIEWAADMVILLLKKVKEMAMEFMDVDSPEELMANLWRLAKILLGILVFTKIVTLIYDLIYMFTAIGSGARLLGKAGHLVADSFSGLLDSLAGDSFSGMLRMFALLMISFGYALNSVIKASKALQDPKTMKMFIFSMGMMVLLILVFVHGVKKIMKVQGKMTKKVVQDLDGIDTAIEESTSALKGVGSAMVGLAAAMIGISASIYILAKAAQGTSVESMVAAVSAIVIIMLFMGLMLRLMRGESSSQKMSSVTKTSAFKGLLNNGYAKDAAFKKNEIGSINETATVYKGIAPALIGFAFAISLLTIPIAILAHTANKVKPEAMNKAVSGILGAMLIIGATMVLITKFNTGKTLPSLALALVIGAMSKMIIAFGIGVALLAAALAIVPSDAYGTLTGLVVLMTLIFIVMATVIAIIAARSKEYDWKAELGKAAGKLLKVFFASQVLIGVALILGVILGTIIVFIGMMKDVNLTKGLFGVPKELWIAIALIVGILAIVTIFAIVVAKSLGKLLGALGSGDWKTMAAKGGTLVLAMYSCIVMLVVMVSLVMSLATFFSGDLISARDVAGALLTITAVAAIIVGIMWGVGMLAKVLSNSSSSDAGDAGTVLLKVAAAIIVVSVALSSLIGIIVGLAYAFSYFDNNELWKALGLAAAAIGLLVLSVAALALVGKLGAPGLYAIALALGAIVAVIIIAVAAMAFMMIYGDKLQKWLKDNSEKIRSTMQEVGKSMAAMLAGFIEGVNEHLPDILYALDYLVTTILSWLEEKVGPWVESLMAILAEILVGIGEGIENNKEKFVEGITKIVLGLWHVLKGVLSNFSNLFEQQLADWFGDPQEELRRDMEDSERKHQEEMYKIRQQGAEAYIKLLEDQEKAEEALHDVVEAYGKVDANGNITNTADIMRAQQNLNAAKNNVESVADYKWSWYDVDKNKSSEENKADSKYMQDYDEQWDYAENKAKEAGEEVGKAFGDGVGEGTRKSLGVKSPSKIFKWLAEMCTKGFNLGADGEGSGESYGSGLISGLKNTISGFKGTVLGSLGLDNMASIAGGDAGSIMGSSMLDSYNDSVSSMDFSTGYGDLSQDAYHFDNYDNLLGDYGKELDLQANLNTNVTNDQLGQVSSAVDSSNEKVVTAINELKEQWSGFLDALNNAKVVMDTGETVGVLAVPMDKALGNLQKLHTRI